MKIVVISDSHGNIANLKHVLGFAKKIKAEAIIHCGDW
ncbi:YfcE family phosphodiesterase, partial [Candidatus Woesebacteria bacterium CG22_combo_CG10-13_8_21_14_all_45_10]